jgi:hypothetical protein
MTTSTPTERCPTWPPAYPSRERASNTTFGFAGFSVLFHGGEFSIVLITVGILVSFLIPWIYEKD